jgi:hypothetical protein
MLIFSSYAFDLSVSLLFLIDLDPEAVIEAIDLETYQCHSVLVILNFAFQTVLVFDALLKSIIFSLKLVDSAFSLIELSEPSLENFVESMNFC